MKIDVRDRDLEPTEALRDYVGLRLTSVLDHLVRHLDGVTVCLAPVPARGGGIDTRCRMLARLAPSGEVRVEETAHGLYPAVDRAAERLAQGVALERARGATAGALGRRRRLADSGHGAQAMESA